jgi:pyrroline-5-carboxylate reductase
MQNLKIIELENLASMDFDLIVLAVKPKDALSADQSIFNIAPNASILTVVAGISSAKYSKPHAIIRAMPNTACSFRKGLTAVYAEDQSSAAFKTACFSASK